MHRNQFRRLELFYALALMGIALSILITGLLVQQLIGSQDNDAYTINIAGRQRMLSQKIAKLAVLYQNQGQANIAPHYQDEMRQALQLWTSSHQTLVNEGMGLEGEQLQELQAMFNKLDKHYQRMVEAAGALLEKEGGSDNGREVYQILVHERQFLRQMNAIVSFLEEASNKKLVRLSHIEYWLMSISLGIVLLELIFIFRPIAKQVNRAMNQLILSEHRYKKMAQQVSKLYGALTASYQALEAVNLEPPSPQIFARMTKEGEFFFFAELLSKIMGYGEEEFPPKNLVGLLATGNYGEGFCQKLLQQAGRGEAWHGEWHLTSAEGDFCILYIHLIPVNGGEEIKVIGQDITEIAEAERRSEEINREKIDAKVKEQNYRSVLILEGQEEERKRLARELHDGVGQALSALRLTLEAIVLTDSSMMRIRLRDSRDLVKRVIQEVRRVSFNLTPSSLDDFGLVPAVKKLADEINRVSKTEVQFENQTNFSIRLQGHIETHLYRIVQEALNNSIKYAKANQVSITFAHTLNTLTIIIKDDGRGFDLEKMKSSGHWEKSGHGLFNMRERAAFIGAVFTLQSKLAEGTRIAVKLELDAP